MNRPVVNRSTIAARNGFAAPFRQNVRPGVHQVRINRWPVRQAWRRGFRAAFVPWIGPVFWPYIYADIFSYTFWPYAYEDGYWAYVYDDFFDTVFWAPDVVVTAHYAYEPEVSRRSTRGSRGSSSAYAKASPQTVQQLCGDPDKGITAWPFAEIERAVQPTEEQRALLEEMKQTATRAAEIFEGSCAGTFPRTPPGRLDAMIVRIRASLDAVREVRPALERFYDSLSDEQKARFNALGPEGMPRTAQDRDARPDKEANASCDRKPDLATLPIERIEQVVRPTDAQRQPFEALRDATVRTLDILQAACPNEIPQTPVGRLDAMEKRLSAMLEAASMVQPPLQQFYASLSNEQKARFNTMKVAASR